MHKEVATINIIDKKYYVKNMNHPEIITRRWVNYPFPETAKGILHV